jgi:tetratricopeptide (TPR) repeat protein
MPAAAGLLGLAAAISWMALKPPPELASALELARHAMAAGRYPEAMRQYGRAKALDAANPQALLGEKKAALAEKITHDAHDDRAGFWGELQTLRQAAPKDGDLLMLEGDLRLRDPQPENRALARPLYLQALQAEPRLAEAHFRLGVLSAQAGDAKDAIQHYQDAAKLEPDEKYLGNLAEQYFRQGQYPQAIQAYEALDEYPLAWLEAAKAHWALGEPQKASDGQAQALRWLDSPQILALPKNRVQCLLDSGFSVATASCQRYYAALALSASRFMSGTLENPPEAGGCGQPGEIRKAVAEDLKRYAAPRSPQAEAFAKRLAQ